VGIPEKPRREKALGVATVTSDHAMLLIVRAAKKTDAVYIHTPKFNPVHRNVLGGVQLRTTSPEGPRCLQCWLLLTSWLNLDRGKRRQLNALFALNRRILQSLSPQGEPLAVVELHL
jgi:hypothetical protein